MRAATRSTTREKSLSLRFAAVPVLLALLPPVAPAALAQVCGDVNNSGAVTTSDALSVLKKAVGQDVALACSGDCLTLDPRVAALEDALASTQASLAEAQDLLAEASAAIVDLQDLLAGVTRDGNTIVVSGANLQVVDGSGSTSGVVNGLGNVIIGYNEKTAGQVRTGSHNLVIGPEHAYSSFGGIVAGESNSISARAASVLGGEANAASGADSVVVGGSDNTASGQYAAVGGGFSNLASGMNAAVSAGCENTASNSYAAVSGGRLGVASGGWSSVQGGLTNKATALYSAVSGGNTYTASTQYGWKPGILSEAP